MNIDQIDESPQSLVASDEGLLPKDESNKPRNAQSSTTSKPPVSKKKIAISLSNFLKKQRAALALRRQGDWKQA
jgi:hypothetical protein